jgi:hypothetical protein
VNLKQCGEISDLLSISIVNKLTEKASPEEIVEMKLFKEEKDPSQR